MAVQAPLKQIAVYKQTHDAFSSRVDTVRTNKLNRVFFERFSQFGGLSTVGVSTLKLPEKNNEGMRSAIYQYHLENPLKGIMGLRVIDQKETSVIYYNDNTYSNLYVPLNKIITPLDCRQVTLTTNFVMSVTKELREGIIREWAAKKGISTNFKRQDQWMDEQMDFFGALEATLEMEYPRRKNIEERRTDDLNENRLTHAITFSP